MAKKKYDEPKVYNIDPEQDIYGGRGGGGGGRGGGKSIPR